MGNQGVEADEKQKRGNGISRITIRLLQWHIAFETVFLLPTVCAVGCVCNVEAVEMRASVCL